MSIYKIILSHTDLKAIWQATNKKEQKDRQSISTQTFHMKWNVKLLSWSMIKRGPTEVLMMMKDTLMWSSSPESTRPTPQAKNVNILRESMELLTSAKLTSMKVPLSIDKWCQPKKKFSIFSNKQAPIDKSGDQENIVTKIRKMK